MTDPQFFNSAIVRVPERLILARGSWRQISIGVRYGLIEHPKSGRCSSTPVMVRGLPAAAQRHAETLYRPAAPTAAARHPAAGSAGDKRHRPADIRLIILTHFHPDHIAGLKDFPNARILANAGAFRQVEAMGALRRLRHGVFAELLPADFAARLTAIEDLPTVPLPLGLGTGRDVSAMAAVSPLICRGTPSAISVWSGQRVVGLLYAVDTQWLIAAVLGARLPHGPARLIYANDAAMRATAEKVRHFADQGGDVLLCHERLTP